MRTFIEDDRRAVEEPKMRPCCRNEAQYIGENFDEWFCEECGERWRLAGTFREYDCGCCQELQHLCKEADRLEAAMHNATQERWIMEEHADHFDDERRERFARKEDEANRAFYGHFEGRSYRDVPETVFYAEEPDDGYDEDPRGVGYPS
jgi:hypothetical protein